MQIITCFKAIAFDFWLEKLETIKICNNEDNIFCKGAKMKKHDEVGFWEDYFEKKRELTKKLRNSTMKV